MLFVFLSICCSVIVSVMLKLARRYHIDVYQAVTWNYSMAILLTWFFYRPSLTNLSQSPVYNYIALGVLFPALFIVMATSVRKAGIVRTDVAQRFSLFIPIIAAFLLFGEASTPVKIIGIILAFIAILCSIPWQKSRGRVNSSKEAEKGSWVYLLIVFLGFGVIDVLLKQITKVNNVPFTTAIFVIFILAFALSFIGLIYQVATKKMRFSWPHILIGWVLGLFNFGNILFYLKAHKALANNPSSVFSSMNIGVIVVGALIGMIIFKEKLSTLNKIGLLVAVLAIVVIYFPQTLGFLHL
ncbi:EamA family transporter [Mucilaginibacter ginsenosidivorax]|uniref:EamA/RhaT family transporter n=1 Tax=Mucilaginibacter ginsenosidivorax TaxID=862126 RepID=A0A5B8VSJ8_9SPHI|nr:EamA/RhaT family transporter [Mucilaginibacter ginsenosidivorax]QEC74567.1 EamA/RhaT family transporter [Mucilaginibacter ginsenosidivorax]